MGKSNSQGNKYALPVIGGVLALGLVLELITGKKAKTPAQLTSKIDQLKKEFPNYSTNINHSSVAGELYSQMEGINWVSTPDYELIYDLPKDDDVKIIYHLFNYLFEPKGTDTLTTWIDEESDNWTGGRQKALNRLYKLELP